jgi:hypothetical protein
LQALATDYTLLNNSWEQREAQRVQELDDKISAEKTDRGATVEAL